ncbi:MAG: hypothetical protein ACO1SX_25450 [Actinomycetota bacterium]
MLDPTKDLSEALNRFNPLHPLREGEELTRFYVRRPYSPLGPLYSYLRVQEKPVKVLFMGHRGSGKSTELAKLGSQLHDRFSVVHFQAGNTLNLNDVEPMDVVLGCGLAILNTVLDRDLDKSLDVWDDLETWMRSEVLTEAVHVRASPRPKEVGVSLKFFVGELSAKWGAESATRKTVRPRLQTTLSEFVSRINEIIRRTRGLYGNPPILLVEDLDKTPLTQARRVFFEEGQLLRLLDCRAIYTFPIALRYSNDYAQIRNNFEFDFKLPNVKINHRSGVPDEVGRSTLRDLVLKRADPSLFAPGAIDAAVEWCGGLVVDLIRLIQGAVLRAIVEGSEQVTRQMVDAVAAEIRSDFRAALGSAHYKKLRECATKHDCMNDAAVQEVLHNLALLEYRNAEDWCDVHPIVRPLLERAEG